MTDKLDFWTTLIAADDPARYRRYSGAWRSLLWAIIVLMVLPNFWTVTKH